MKRLTKRWGEQPYPNLAGKVVCEYKECDSAKSCNDCVHGRIANRLASIEDILGDEYDLDRLRELAQADREGRCVVLETDRKKLETAFNIAVKYGFCGDCRWVFEDKHCLECGCYQDGVKIIKEALFGGEAVLRREQE